MEMIFWCGASFIFGFILACWIIRRALRNAGPVVPNRSNSSGYGY